MMAGPRRRGPWPGPCALRAPNWELPAFEPRHPSLNVVKEINKNPLKKNVRVRPLCRRKPQDGQRRRRTLRPGRSANAVWVRIYVRHRRVYVWTSICLHLCPSISLNIFTSTHRRFAASTYRIVHESTCRRTDAWEYRCVNTSTRQIVNASSKLRTASRD